MKPYNVDEAKHLTAKEARKKYELAQLNYYNSLKSEYKSKQDLDKATRNLTNLERENDLIQQTKSEDGLDINTITFENWNKQMSSKHVAKIKSAADLAKAKLIYKNTVDIYYIHMNQLRVSRLRVNDAFEQLATFEHADLVKIIVDS